MMNQEKECFDFIEKNVNEPYKTKILKVLTKIKEYAKERDFEAPCVGRIPEESNRWSLWWKDKKSHISIDFYPNEEKDIFFYYRKLNSLTSAGFDTEIEFLHDAFIKLILEVKNNGTENETFAENIFSI